MSQTWTTNVYDIDHIVDTDMTNIEVNFATLKNSFAGTTSPTATVAGQIYFNTAKKIHHFLNTTESAFLALLTGDLSTKIWQYRNDATPGWIIDNSVTDKVIALKGGSNAYNVSGGSTGGTWVQPVHNHTVSNHTHTSATHKHLTPFAKGGYQEGLAIKATIPGGYVAQDVNYSYSAPGGGWSGNLYWAYTDNTTPGSTGSSGAQTSSTGSTVSTYRPTAAVGTLQYPDVTQA